MIDRHFSTFVSVFDLRRIFLIFDICCTVEVQVTATQQIIKVDLTRISSETTLCESLCFRVLHPARSWWTPSAPEPQRTNLNILRQAVPATRMAADPLISESHRRRAARPRVLLLAHRATAAQADSAGGLHNLKKAEAVQKHDERFTQRHLKLVLLSKSLDRFEGYEWSVVAIETACSIPNLRRREFSVWV